MRDESRPELDELITEYIDRLAGGEKIDPEDILLSHPDSGVSILDELRAYLDLANDTGSGVEAVGTLGDYTLRCQIGRGGMGTVYDAWQNSMDRRVALKVLPRALAADARAATRLIREAQIAGKLDHPNVVHIHGTGVEEQVPYYAMEYVEGETLAQVVGRLKEAEPETDTPFGTKDQIDYFARLARAFADVADGLQHAHSRAVIHRDIKPSNLIFDPEGRLRILDFGLARLEGQESLTLSGDFVGTPAYMSPEQARRRKIPIDHRTDIYSLGATLYELLTHAQPFRGTDHADTLSQIIERDPRPPRQWNPRVPQDLETIVLKCLRKDAGDRYHTAEALGQDLRRFVRGDAIEARPQSTFEKAARRLWRHRLVVAGACVLLLLSLIGTTIANVFIAHARDEATRSLEVAVYDRYVADMRLAMAEWEVGNIRSYTRLLERYIPESGLEHLRGWEWYYLRSRESAALFTLEGHSGPVRSIDWAPEGELLVSGGEDGAVILWNGSTGGFIKRLVSAGPPVTSVAWNFDGTLLAIATTEAFARVIDPQSGEELAARVGQGGANCVAWSPNENLLASAGKDGKVIIFAGAGLVGDRELDVGKPSEYGVVALDWSPGGDQLAAASRWPAKTVVWRTETWSECFQKRNRRWVLSVAWRPGASQLAVAGADQSVQIWDTDTSTEGTALEHQDEVRTARWNSKGNRLASGCANGMAYVWRPTTDEQPIVLRAHEGAVASVAWSATGSLATSGRDGTVRIWEPSQDGRVIRLPGEHPAAWSACGRWLAMENMEGGRVVVLDAGTLERAGALEEHTEGETSVAFSPDGGLLAIREPRGEVHVWDWRTRTRRAVLSGRKVRNIAWSPDDRHLAVARDGDAGVQIWDTATWEAVHATSTSEEAVAWSPDGVHLATRGRDQAVRVWLAENWELVRELPLEVDRIIRHHALAWSPDGQRLAAGNAAGELLVWDVTSGDEEFREPGHGSEVRSVAWSGDGERIATGSNDRTVKIWDARTGEELLTLRGHEFIIMSLAWSRDGQRLLSAEDEPNGVRIWDASPAYNTVGE